MSQSFFPVTDRSNQKPRRQLDIFAFKCIIHSTKVRQGEALICQSGCHNPPWHHGDNQGIRRDKVRAGEVITRAQVKVDTSLAYHSNAMDVSQDNVCNLMKGSPVLDPKVSGYKLSLIWNY